MDTLCCQLKELEHKGVYDMCIVEQYTTDMQYWVLQLFWIIFFIIAKWNYDLQAFKQ